MVELRRGTCGGTEDRYMCYRNWGEEHVEELRRGRYGGTEERNMSRH